MSTYTIGEAADRSGFSASALRYYEGIGLVTPASRTNAGYRLYDDHTLARLAFIARAKQLGCSLEEVTDLVEIWDGERCGPVQRRFHDLITAKIDTAQRQITDLVAFAGQLQTAAAQLNSPAVDGPCGDGCACLAEGTEPAAATTPIALSAKPSDVPIACTLDPGAMPNRLADWQQILDHAISRTAAADGSLRIELGSGVDAAELARLVTAEQGCCAFFGFTITVDARGLGLEITAPEGGADVVDALFGRPA